MTDKKRTAQMDAVLARLAAVAGRPWDDKTPEPEDPPPDPPRSRRVPMTVLAGVAVVGAVITGFVTLSEAPPTEPPPNLAAATVEVPASAAAVVVVDVAGKVARPGLLTLPDGSRVDDALRASGGVLPGADAGSLNLARKLVDGEQLHVGVPAPPEQRPAAPTKVDLNTATAAQLDTLPGVGAVTAQRILDWRAEHGRFTRVEQLRDVEGIGPAKFDDLRALVTVR